MFLELSRLSLNGVSFNDVWNALGVELVIFSVTVVFAMAIRLANAQKHTNTKGKLRKIVENVSAHNRSTPPLPMQKAGEVPAHSVGGARSTYQKLPRGQGSHIKNKQPWELVNSIMALMRDSPSQRSAGQALQLYSELRASFGLLSDENTKELSSSICDIMRRSKHTAIDLYTTLVQCSVRSAQCYLVESLVADMVRLGVARPLCFYETTMKQLAGQKQFKLALNVNDQLQADGLQPSATTCSCLVSFATELGDVDRALKFFETLSTLTTPSIRAYMTLLRALSKHQDWTKSLAMFRDMQQRNVAVDSFVLNIVLATGVAADRLSEVKDLLVEADSMSPPISDVVSYNTLIKGYAQRNDADLALHVVSLMQRRSLQPNAITFNTVMDAIVRSGDCEKVWEVLKKMRMCGFRPDKFTCSILIKGLAKQPTPAMIQTALDMLDESVDNRDPALLTSQYNSIVAAAASVPDKVLMMQAVSKMRQRGISLSESSSSKLRACR